LTDSNSSWSNIRKTTLVTIPLLVLAALAGLITYLITYQPTDVEIFRNALYKQVSTNDIQKSFYATNGTQTFDAVIKSDFSEPAAPETYGEYSVTVGTGRGIVNDFVTDTQTTAIRAQDFLVSSTEPNEQVLNKWFYIQEDGEVVGDDQGAFSYIGFINSPLSELPSGRFDSSIRQDVFNLLLDAYAIKSSERQEVGGVQAVRYDISVNEEALLAANSLIAETYEIPNVYDGNPNSFNYSEFVIWVNEDTNEIELVELNQFGQASTVRVDYPLVNITVPEQEITYEEFVQGLFAPQQNSTEPQA